jgi:hypothetical protein
MPIGNAYTNVRRDVKMQEDNRRGKTMKRIEKT